MARLSLLGDVRLIAADGSDATPRSAKAQALLAYLALAPKGTVDRGKVAGVLWSEGSNAKASLRQCIRELRETLGAVGLNLLNADLQRITLNLATIWIDALEIERLAESADVTDASRMTALYAGDFLDRLEVHEPDFVNWAEIERSRLHGQACRWLVRSLRHSVSAGDQGALNRAAEGLLALDPAHEEAHRALMRHYVLIGNSAAAIRQYHECRQALARQLDMTPSAETEALVQEIRSGNFRVAGKPASPQALQASVPHRLRATLSVGQQSMASAGSCEAMALAALAVGLRRALLRKGILSVVDTSGIPAPGGDAKQASPNQPSYHVELSLLRTAAQMRLCAELVETEFRRFVCVEQYDCSTSSDVLAEIDHFASDLAWRVHQEVELVELTRASCRPVETLSSYERVLRAIPLLFKLTPASFLEAGELLRSAERVDPSDPLVHVWLSFWCLMDVGQGWARNLDAAREELGFLSRRAIELDPKNSEALAVAGHIASYINHDYERALDLLQCSLRMDPNSARARDLYALTLCYTGKVEDALRELQGCQKLWQQHPDQFCFRTSTCIAHLLAGHYDAAASIGQKIVLENPNYQAVYQPLIASLGHLNRIDEARNQLANLQRIQPDFSVGWFRTNYPPLLGGYDQLYIQGLRKAGVGE